MGLTIKYKYRYKYRQKAKGAKALTAVNWAAGFVGAMERAFGFPGVLDKGDIPKLEGMAAVFGGENNDNPYLQLICILTATPDGVEVEVWAES